MTIMYEQRASDSPFVDTITRGYTASDGVSIRPAEISWHMIFQRRNGSVQVFVVGPWTSAGTISYTAGAELLWIRLKLGTFMPHLPASEILNTEALLPGTTRRSFRLNGSSWQLPDWDNADTFVDQLARRELLVCDPLVEAVMDDRAPAFASRTLRHRFVRATGLTHRHIRQVQRAQHAAELLRHGASIGDTMFDAGYFDQPHLTRSLKQFVGHTPAQLAREYAAC